MTKARYVNVTIRTEHGGLLEDFFIPVDTDGEKISSAIRELVELKYEVFEDFEQARDWYKVE
jgi:hypothetical protein